LSRFVLDSIWWTRPGPWCWVACQAPLLPGWRQVT